MSRKNVRRMLLFAPLALAVACSNGPVSPNPPQDPPTGQNQPTQGVMQPAQHDTLHVVPGSG